MSQEGKYRRGVGVMLLNHQGKVFVGARIDNTDEAWQMPNYVFLLIAGLAARTRDAAMPRPSNSTGTSVWKMCITPSTIR